VVKESILMTVCDREPEILMNTLRWLRLLDLSESEIVIVDDGSTLDYSFVPAVYGNHMPIRWVTMEPYERFTTGEMRNYGNPSKAFNRALSEAHGDRLVILSSDVIVPPGVLKKARIQASEGQVWCPMVIDLGSSMEYCGPNRVFPMPWMLCMPKELMLRAGGWDEAYLGGLCYEDNDVLGRLALSCESIICDWGSVVWHQSHYQPAYIMEEQTVRDANARNRQLTLDKWNGIPFGDSDLIAFGIKRSRDAATGNFSLTFEDIRSCREKVIAATVSSFVTVPA
jgi:glycosyltransferase involved in cell wall biosynthesis